MGESTYLQLNRISKLFPGVKALDRIDLSIKKGEVHALLGENGAGKSTLMNVITGNYKPEEGEILLEGVPVLFNKTEDSQRAGIGLVHQENSLLPYLDVKSNLYLGHYPSKLGFINSALIRKRTKELFKQLKIEGINPDALIQNLSMAQRQLVEIAKAISINPRLLLLDEPTASLTDKETDILFDIIADLKQKNVAIVYISHRMEEIFKVADTITVFRDGTHVITDMADSFTIESLISHMVGRSLNSQMDSLLKNRNQIVKDRVVMEVQGLCRKGEFEDISFQLKEGEVLGLGGLVGAGRSELLETIFGYRRLENGEIWMDGKEVKIAHPKAAIKYRLAFVPEDRKQKGLSLIASVKENINIATLGNYKKRFLLSSKKQTEAAIESVSKLDIKTPSVEKIVGQLSGGNQQKTIIARWLLTKPKILLLDEPTHGIDVGAKLEIYQMIESLTKQGISIIVASSEMSELMLLSDRIIVMHSGKTTGVITKAEATQEKILSYASGYQKTGGELI